MKYIFGFLTIAILMVGCKSDVGSPKVTVTAFLEAMKKGDIEGVKKLVTKSDVSLFTMMESFAKISGKDVDVIEKMKKEFVEKSKNVSYAIKDEKIDGDKATVNVELKETDKTTTQPFQLVKEDGSWKVSLLSTGLNMRGADRDSDTENINMSDSIKKAMEQLKDINLDSIHSQMKGAEDKLKEFQEKNPEAMKKAKEMIKKMEDSLKTIH